MFNYPKYVDETEVWTKNPQNKRRLYDSSLVSLGQALDSTQSSLPGTAALALKNCAFYLSMQGAFRVAKQEVDGWELLRKAELYDAGRELFLYDVGSLKGGSCAPFP